MPTSFNLLLNAVDFMSTPLISIIIPTYNRSALIGESIQSVLNQSYTHWELIIVDDGSDDDTQQVVSNFRDERISYHSIAHCGIFGKVRNEGLRRANGEYVAFLDSDDLWRADKLAMQVDLMRQYPEIFFVFTNVTIFGSRAFDSPPDYDELFVGSILLSMLEETRFVFYPSTLLFRKKIILDRIGMMDEALSYGTDTKYFLNMCQYFKGAFTNKRLVEIRRHDHSTTENYSTTEVFLDSINIASAIYEAGSITKPQHNRILGHYYYKMGLAELFSLNRPRQAVASFVNGVFFTPLQWKNYVRLLQAFLFLMKQSLFKNKILS
jgi:glycosyltransferase involved in cell wall biosynthesis